MLFSSSIFILVFLPVALLGFQLLGRFGRRAVFSWLVLMSCIFYGYWDPKFLALLGSSIFLNYAASKLIVRFKSSARSQTGVLVSAITANILLLFWFKYLFPLLGFFHNIGWTAHSFGTVILPLGISFFTFTQIAFLIDLKEGIAEEQGLLSYLLFVTFFPHLIAGPIIHHSEMMPQFNTRAPGGLRADDMTVGLTWFTLGLAKKVLIADHCAPIADLYFNGAANYGTAAAWIGVLAYVFQLYFDFSGYSDMALGLARMFSIDFPINFNSPFKSRSIIEFWQRWHITLTNYLTMYLYNPIALHFSRRRMDAGKKVSKKATRTLDGFSQLVAIPVLVTMFLAGIWHGAGVQFIIFGALHGIYITINYAWRVFVPDDSKWQKLLPPPISIAITFLAVLVTNVFFRARSARQGVYILGTLLGTHGHLALNDSQLQGHITATTPHAQIATLTICFFIVWALPNTQQILGQLTPDALRSKSLFPHLRWRPTILWAVVIGVLCLPIFMIVDQSTTFLYFQF